MHDAGKPPARRRIAMAGIVLGACLAWYGWTYRFLPAGASTASLLHAAAVFDQCSRRAPKPDGPYWIPTAAQIRAIEPSLPAIGRMVPKHHFNVPKDEYRYLHQYMGFTLHGKRLIYVNVAPDDWRYETEYNAREGRKRPLSEELKHLVEGILPERALGTCDGGAFFWGVVVDPATGRFQHPEFNGAS